jgi:LCP family protein required for cell wall assembly
MEKKQMRLLKQLVLLTILFIVCIVSSGMIYLGATIFRMQLPFFQLIDSKDNGNLIVEPLPTEEPLISEDSEDSDVKLFMVMGSDFRPESGFRTDTLMLVAFHQKSGKASIVSFPRDLWVTIPGYGEERINTVMQLGGFPLFAEMMQTNFGLYPTQYAMIDMEGFLQIIDELGGIEFETEYVTADGCDGSLDPDGWCEVGPGLVSLDSDWALWYVRARYNSSDFERMRRTQEVVGAAVKKIISPTGFLKMPSLMKIYDTNVETNISSTQILSFARFGLGFDFNEDVRRFTIGENETTGWITAAGAMVLLPNVPAIQAVLQDAITFE